MFLYINIYIIRQYHQRQSSRKTPKFRNMIVVYNIFVVVLMLMVLISNNGGVYAEAPDNDCSMAIDAAVSNCLPILTIWNIKSTSECCPAVKEMKQKCNCTIFSTENYCTNYIMVLGWVIFFYLPSYYNYFFDLNLILFCFVVILDMLWIYVDKPPKDN